MSQEATHLPSPPSTTVGSINSITTSKRYKVLCITSNPRSHKPLQVQPAQDPSLERTMSTETNSTSGLKSAALAEPIPYSISIAQSASTTARIRTDLGTSQTIRSTGISTPSSTLTGGGAK
ncbi:hypothetical protein FRC15_001609 [Serendipita sp. 397]|nr:hypothetical protein FRC15_001609 [Serendipita sp. 397]